MGARRKAMTTTDPLSASRIQTWMNCNRKAAWTYIAGYEDPGNEDTNFGQKVHAELEAAKSVPGYLPNRMTEVGAVASEALPYVEDFTPETGAKPEGEFWTHPGKHQWMGFIDLRKPGHLVDYKTTGDFRWAKTEADLLHDPQAVLYAVYELMRSPHLNEVTLTWLYLRKRYPYAAKPVRITMTREHAMRAFAALESYGDEMYAAAAAAPADPAARHKYVLDVIQANPEHCDAYRGCPHSSRCNIPFFSNPTSKGKTVNLLEKLEAMNNDAAPPPAPVDMAPMVGVPTPLVLQADGKVGYVSPAPPGITFDASWALAPDSPPDTVPAIPAAMPVPEGVTAPMTAYAPEPGQINPPKRRPGRPRKDAAAAAPPPAPTPEPAPQAMTPASVMKELAVSLAPLAAAPTPGKYIGTLYIGCAPRRCPDAADFDAIVAEAKVAIGPANYYAAFGYKANGMLLQMVEGMLQHRKPGAVVIARPTNPEAVLCLSTLCAAAEEVVEAA